MGTTTKYDTIRQGRTPRRSISVRIDLCDELIGQHRAQTLANHLDITRGAIDSSIPRI